MRQVRLVEQIRQLRDVGEVKNTIFWSHTFQLSFQETEIGKVVNGLKKSADDRVSSVARNIIQKWKEVVAQEEEENEDDDEEEEEVVEDVEGMET